MCSLAAVALWMLLIFALSAQPAADSQALSDGVLEIFLHKLHLPFTSFAVRKAAHAAEYMVLGILSFAALYAVFYRKMPIGALVTAALYAVSDEIHQRFVPGRACQLRDVCIDLGGALTGVLLCMGVYCLVQRIQNKKGEKKHGNHSTVSCL